MTSISKVGKGVRLSKTLQPDDGLLQVDVIPGTVSGWTLLGIFISFSDDADHLPRYKDRAYFSYMAKELHLEAQEGLWTSAGAVARNTQLHFVLHHCAITFLI